MLEATSAGVSSSVMSVAANGCGDIHAQLFHLRARERVACEARRLAQLRAPLSFCCPDKLGKSGLSMLLGADERER